jgi:hypothetical protein
MQHVISTICNRFEKWWNTSYLGVVNGMPPSDESEEELMEYLEELKTNDGLERE